MTTIIKTITKRDRSGLSLFKVETLSNIDLRGLTFSKYHTNKDKEIYVYENELLCNHSVKVEIIRTILPNPLMSELIRFKDKISHGKAGWNTLNKNLNSIIKNEPWI